ncbi:MAG: nucleotidyltransferase family protein [Rhizobiaceae bacterium]
MDRDSIIATLRKHQQELHRQGVSHVALFGSFARDEANRSSDIDILIDLDPDVSLSVFDYVGVKDYIAGLFDMPVDVVNRRGLKSHLRTHALADVVDAF